MAGRRSAGPDVEVRKATVRRRRTGPRSPTIVAAQPRRLGQGVAYSAQPGPRLSLIDGAGQLVFVAAREATKVEGVDLTWS